MERDERLLLGSSFGLGFSQRCWPGMRSEYNWLPAGASGTRTGAHQIGVSFSGHSAAVFESGGRVSTGDIADGSVIVSGAEPITWLEVPETTEALEIYPDIDLAGPDHAPLLGDRAPRESPIIWDGTVLAIASVLKRVHTAGTDLSDIAASTLAHRLAEHLREHYRGRAGPYRPAKPRRGRLDRRIVDRVTEYVEAGLAGPVTLDRLAAVAALSPYHFARAFRSTTGLAPHQFVTSRRVDRATLLLLRTDKSVADIATAVGMPNTSHFRRVYARHAGVLPGQVRRSARP